MVTLKKSIQFALPFSILPLLPAGVSLPAHAQTTGTISGVVTLEAGEYSFAALLMGATHMHGSERRAGSLGN